MARPAADLQARHRRLKLELMGRSPSDYRKLGRLAAAGAKAEYEALLERTLQVPLTSGNQANVLEHALGYFKRCVDGTERRRILAEIHGFREGRLEYRIPFESIRILVDRHEVAYLKEQSLFEREGGE